MTYITEEWANNWKMVFNIDIQINLTIIQCLQVSYNLVMYQVEFQQECSYTLKSKWSIDLSQTESTYITDQKACILYLRHAYYM